MRKFCISLAAVTVLAVLAGAMLPVSCGKSGNAPDPGPVEPSDTASVSPADTSSTGNDFREEPDDTSSDPVRTFDYSAVAKMGHPRLLMDAEDFADLKTKVTSGRFSNKTLYKMHKLVLDCADSYVADNTAIEHKFDASSKRILDQSRLALKRLFACAYAYRLTGKATYLAKAVSDLETVCKFSDWNPSHFLDTGEMALGVAIAYDWLYYELSYEDRVLIHRALVNMAIRPSIGAGFHTSEGNWNQVCNAGIIAAALAVYEKDKAVSVNVIETGIADNKTINAMIYGPDGNYSEGYDYWGYGTGFEVVLVSMLERVFGSCNGIKDVDGFLETGKYMLYMTGPVQMDFPYSDGGQGKESPKLAMWWFAAEENDPSLLYNEWRMFNAGSYASSSEVRLLPAVPCFIRNRNFDDISTVSPSKDIWYGYGKTPVVMVHTGWNSDESDHYLCIKGGAANSSGHGHMDAGSFVYDSQGVRWSEDLMRPSYSSMENALSAAGGSFWSMSQKSLRWDVFRMNNLCHSTLSFDNPDGSVSKRYPTDHVVGGKATLESVYESSSELGAALNMTAPLADQVAEAHRRIKLIDRSYVEITDVITAKSGTDAEMQWRMLTGAAVSVGSEHETLTRSGKTLYLQASSSVPVTYTSWTATRPSTWTSRSWDPGNSGYIVAGYTATIPAGQTVTFVTTLKPAL